MKTQWENLICDSMPKSAAIVEEILRTSGRKIVKLKIDFEQLEKLSIKK